MTSFDESQERARSVHHDAPKPVMTHLGRRIFRSHGGQDALSLRRRIISTIGSRLLLKSRDCRGQRSSIAQHVILMSYLWTQLMWKTSRAHTCSKMLMWIILVGSLPCHSTPSPLSYCCCMLSCAYAKRMQRSRLKIKHLWYKSIRTSTISMGSNR